ncbi:MAG TPA: pectate lyase [Sunxiuqinia sp.]|nr:pectate lyase [Sunxiuqinia sp.]
MKILTKCLAYVLLALISAGQVEAQNQKMVQEAKTTMLRATKFMVDKVSTNGGYVWYYLPDFSRRWGEMEAYKTMIWMQHPGTISMGNLFLDAYSATGKAYYYQAAEKAAAAIIWGQSREGGWNYVVDFAGDRSLKEWYNTIGKNGWRLEEFQHYYGNSTFDDDVTSDAAKFLLRMYLEKLDPKYKPALDKAINFILKSQYPIGGWPQRYPLMHDFNKQGHPDYSSYYTFNDDVTWENVHFLIQCYLTLGEERFLDPIRRGMNFYIVSQDGSGAWALQLDPSLHPAGARTYEPTALVSNTTFGNAMLLLKFYEYTGDKKYLARVPAAIKWLEKTQLPKDETENGRYTNPTFVDPKTGEPIYVHRKGSNVKYGFYYLDHKDEHLLGHYGGKRYLPIDYLKAQYDSLAALSPEDVTKNSPLKVGKFTHEGTPQHYYDLYDLPSGRYFEHRARGNVNNVIQSLDDQGRWLVEHAMISHPYIGNGQQKEPTEKYEATRVGDETDTSPYRDRTDQKYISTSAYIHNMNLLIQYIKKNQSQRK